MREYIKPELEFVNFTTEAIADVEQGTAGTSNLDDGL